ncbi:MULTISPECIES: hypothetical protein [Pseudoalteromonas]|uniref:hypothetical protein n=1 Tax=Pseudoalteromonas TaxID=53246 RepID=UPI00029AC44B|nr:MULTISPECIES: hypothetical protein [Pseudoalteromonas]AUJ70691.1 hypothetical protein PNC201_12095 [Pseudoalteromonas sp. NC201]MBR8845352.1 hypothetical protein [Pseudoalteromonas sp. JC3]MCF2825422.1 HlyD family secretion protein [Pseudoalteromonas sp. OF5H-5]MCF2833911.1 HlyD family secretion protein [Pseudoalteromonas sp. DL2-H6]MCF2923199.1 HlyD family secretion protein [Pseudoalteromonas sp. DL2-H1]
MHEVNDNIHGELRKARSKLLKVTFWLFSIALVASLAVTIQLRVVLEEAFIYIVPEPVLHYAERDIIIDQYQVPDGSKVVSDMSMYQAENIQLKDQLVLLRQEEIRDQVQAQALKQKIEQTRSSVAMLSQFEEVEVKSIKAEIIMIEDLLVRLKQELTLLNKDYLKQSTFVEGVTNLSHISKDRKIRYQQDLFHKRAEIIEMEQDIHQQQLKLAQLKNQQSQQQIGLTRQRDMAVTLSVLENEAKVFADSLKLKELELAQLEKNHNRLQGKAEVDGRVEFESLNGIRKTQYRKGELVYTIYPEGQHFVTKGYVDEKHILDIALGKEVEVKLSAYNYLKYGSIKGKVKTIMGVKDGRAEVIIDIVDMKDFKLVHGNSTQAFITLEGVKLYEYVFGIFFPYIV